MISKKEDPLLISQDTLRILIGVLGVTLPVLLVLGAWGFQTSISDYYYTNMRDYFEGVLFFLAVFLVAYRPYGDDGWADSLITSLAGGFSLLLAFFPTVNHFLNHIPESLVLKFIPVEWSINFHNVGSAGLFLCFAVMSLFYFTRGKQAQRTPRKVLRNGIYIACGLGIGVCIGVIGVFAATAGPGGTERLSIFWPEAIALVLFGFSWLVKGGAFPFLNDKA